MHIFVGNFTYVLDFMIVEDISSIIDPRLSQVVLMKPFVEIEQYNSLSNLEKEHTKLVYLRNKEDKRRGVEYVMNKILGFYKECLELGPKYLTGLKDEGGVTLYLTRRIFGVLRSFIGRLLDDDSATLGWLLEEIHVTWAHLEKKRKRVQLYTKSDEENAYNGWR
ncbi:hypothetical protein Tco_1266311 [Tanacetum coccineum]